MSRDRETKEEERERLKRLEKEDEERDARLKRIQRKSSKRDARLYPDEARAWAAHYRRVQRGISMVIPGERRGMDFASSDNDDEMDSYIAGPEAKEKQLAYDSREYQITTSPGNLLFYAGNSYLDFEGNVQLAVKTMAPVDISDDSDSVSDSRSQSADVVVTPDLSNVRLDEQVQSGSDDNSDSDSDSDVEIIEIIEADNQSDHQAGDRNESPELVAPERLPARLAGKPAIRRRIIEAIVPEQGGSDSSSSSSDSEPEEDPRKKSKATAAGKNQKGASSKGEEEFFVDRGQKADKRKAPTGTKKRPRTSLSVYTLANFELRDQNGDLLSLLLLNVKDSSEKRKYSKNSKDSWSIKKFKITGKVIPEDYDEPHREVIIREDDFDLERLDFTFDPITFFLFAKSCTYKIVSGTARYQPQLLKDLGGDFRSKREFLSPEMYQFLPREMWSYFRTDPDVDLTAIRMDLDEDADYVQHSFDLESEEMLSLPLGEPKIFSHTTDFKEISEAKKKKAKKEEKHSQVEPERKSIQVFLEAEIWLPSSTERIKVKAGDCISVCAPSTDAKHPVWFARIVYFYRAIKESKLFAHISYFTSATDTFLGNAASGRRMLFYSDNCTNCPVSAFVRPVEITRLPLHTNLPPPTGYYYAYALEENSRSFVDAEPLETNSKPLDFCSLDGIYGCVCCERQAIALYNQTPRLDRNLTNLQSNGVQYHLNDTICFSRNNKEDKTQAIKAKGPLYLGRITQFRKSKITGTESAQVQIILRNDQIFDSQYKDSRRVMLTKILEDISTTQVVSHIQVDHADVFTGELDLEAFNNDPNAKWPSQLHERKEKLMKSSNWFWTNQILVNGEMFTKNRRRSASDNKRLPIPPNDTMLKLILSSDIKRCPRCVESYTEMMAANETIKGLSDAESRLKAFEAYSGGAILAAGLHEGCPSLSTKFGCDIHQHAVETSRLNTNSASIHHAKTSDVNEAIYNGQTTISGQPAPTFDFVEFVSGGPPCQGYSKANLHRFREDPKCLEPFIFLNSVSLLRPWYVVMENVREIMRFKLPMETDVIQINLLALMYLSLGYQFFDVLLTSQATGGASKRSRYFSIAFLRGTKAPSLPELTHFVPAGKNYHINPVDGSNANQRVETRQHIELHSFVTAGEVLGDLKSYEIARPRRSSTEPLDHSRKSYNPQLWNSKQQSFGYPDETDYQCDIPMNSIQRSLRLSNKGNKISDHISKGYRRGEDAIMVTELGVKGTLSKNGRIQTGNYLDVSPNYRPTLPPNIFEKNIPFFHARLQRDSLLTVIRTTLDVQGYFHGPRYHPEQNRPLSPRELARAQSIPDSYALGRSGSSINEMIKIAGNAVPIVLGSAIGKSVNTSVRALQLEEGGFARTRTLAKTYLLENPYARAKGVLEVEAEVADDSDLEMESDGELEYV